MTHLGRSGRQATIEIRKDAPLELSPGFFDSLPRSFGGAGLCIYMEGDQDFKKIGERMKEFENVGRLAIEIFDDVPCYDEAQVVDLAQLQDGYAFCDDAEAPVSALSLPKSLAECAAGRTPRGACIFCLRPKCHASPNIL